MTDADHNRKGYGREMGTIEGNDNDNDNDNELFIQTKSNEKHHKGNIQKYQHYNVRAKEIALKTSWPLAYNHLFLNFTRRITG